MKNLLSSEEIITYSEGLKLYKNLVLQLNKDFNRANIDTSFINDLSPTELKVKLSEVIQNLLLYNYSDYVNLLYIIDVSEEKIKSIKAQNTQELSENITYLVLLREWQKVWFKSKY